MNNFNWLEIAEKFLKNVKQKYRKSEYLEFLATKFSIRNKIDIEPALIYIEQAYFKIVGMKQCKCGRYAIYSFQSKETNWKEIFYCRNHYNQLKVS